MAGIMVPGQILIVPLFTMMNDLNLVDTYWGVILPQLASPIAVFVFKQFFDGIPRELHEAAIVDGCGMVPSLLADLAAVGPIRRGGRRLSSPLSGPGTTSSGRSS